MAASLALPSLATYHLTTVARSRQLGSRPITCTKRRIEANRTAFVFLDDWNQRQLPGLRASPKGEESMSKEKGLRIGCVAALVVGLALVSGTSHARVSTER